MRVLLILAALSLLPAPFLARQQGDSLVCAQMPDGRPLKLGIAVRDAAGREVGFVSLSQCSLNPGAGLVRVAVEANGKFLTQVYDLRGATLDDLGLQVMSAPLEASRPNV